MREYFHKRGILPKSKTPETLKEGVEPDYSDLFCYDINDFVASPADAYGFIHERRRRFMIPADQDFEIADPYTAQKVRRRQERRPTEIVLQYVWTEDVALEGRARFGSLAGEIVPLICGGTLVYDDEGNLLYWSYKPGTRSFECIRSAKGRAARDQAMEEGARRRERLLEYVESCVSEGLVGVTEGGTFDDVAVTRPVVAERVGSHLRLRVSPHLRHWPDR
jgi:hypothetical protein